MICLGWRWLSVCAVASVTSQPKEHALPLSLPAGYSLGSAPSSKRFAQKLHVIISIAARAWQVPQILVRRPCVIAHSALGQCCIRAELLSAGRQMIALTHRTSAAPGDGAMSADWLNAWRTQAGRESRGKCCERGLTPPAWRAAAGRCGTLQACCSAAASGTRSARTALTAAPSDLREGACIKHTRPTIQRQCRVRMAGSLLRA